MGDDQPVEPEVQLLGHPVVLVVNPPVGLNEDENVAQPQEMEEGWRNAERIWKDRSLLSKLVPLVVVLVSVVNL